MDDLQYHIRNIGKDTPNQVNLIEKDISGGRISTSTIDSLSDVEGKDVLTVSGLNQDTFEYLISKYGKKFRVINFWKCPLVQDFAAIEDLDSVEFISYFWNQRVTRLWNFKKTVALKGFSFDDFTRMHDLCDLQDAIQLKELEFGDKVWVKYKVNSLQPLSALGGLESLSFSAKSIADSRIEPIADIKSLKKLNFPSSLFTTEQVAWLKSKMPGHVDCKMLNPFWKIDKPIGIAGKKKDTFIVGKRKPFLSSEQDDKRIKRYVDEFEKRVNFFLSNPDLLPLDYA